MNKPCEFRGCNLKGAKTYKTDNHIWLCDRHYHLMGYDKWRPRIIEPKKPREHNMNPKAVSDDDVATWLQLREEGLTYEDIALGTGFGRTTVTNILGGQKDFTLSQLEKASEQLVRGKNKEKLAKEMGTTRQFLVYVLRQEGLPCVVSNLHSRR